MYASNTRPQMDEEYFANVEHSKSVESIIPTTELLVDIRLNGLRAKKLCYLYAERMDFKGIIQLRLVEKCDQRRMYITTVDSGSFHELKQDQSLHVTFVGFIENLIHILQECQTGKLEIHIVQVRNNCVRVNEPLGIGTEPTEYQLQFVEMRSFKNLIHLALPSRLAPLNVVLFYMNNLLDTIQRKTNTQEHEIQNLRLEIRTHLRRVEQLDSENLKLRENIIENAKTLNRHHAEEMQQMQESLKKATEQRHNDNERNRKTVSTMQSQLDKLNLEKMNILAEKKQEQKRKDQLNEELTSTKLRLSSLKEQNEKLHAEISSLKNVERQNEMHLGDARKHINELQDQLKKFDKTKADIIAELEAEKKISHTKRQALEIATEEISKANEIILKQTQELIKLKKTISLRTEVSLEQEKAISEKDNLLKLNEEEIIQMRQIIESLRKEIPQQLDSMQKFANSLEQKYSDQIHALRDTLQPKGKENYVCNHVSNRHK